MEWHIEWTENDTVWYVYGGEALLLNTDSKEVAEAFLYGLGLAYSVLPDAVFKSLERNVLQLIAGKSLEP